MLTKLDHVFGLDHAGWPALLVNSTGAIVRANQAAVRSFGPTLEGGAPLLSSVWAEGNDSTADRFLAHWESMPASVTSLKFRLKGGATGTFPVSICSFSRDEQKYFVFQLLPDGAADGKVPGADAVLAQKRKLDCALQLARTVSIDFNNALTSILGYTSLVLSKMEPDNPWRRALMEVEKSAAKAAEIANDLGTFSRQEKEGRAQSSGNLNSILQRSVDAFNRVEGSQIEWTLQFERKLFVAKFDEAKMQQAFVKVLENAVQSLGAEGRIAVQTHNLELIEPMVDRELQLQPGIYVCAEISDSGAGIAPEILPRIFEPFFTTKDPEKHRGLGLALVYGIVTNNGGGIAVSSTAGIGTAVRIYLPAESRIVYDTGFLYKDLNGSQTVLIVDDDDLLLAMGRTILSDYGYQVLTANSGQKAIELFSSHPSPIDLVITDLVMPAMSGRELAEHLRRLSPNTPVICTSGYVRSHNSTQEDASYLQKPFTSQELLAKVKGAILGNIS